MIKLEKVKVTEHPVNKLNGNWTFEESSKIISLNTPEELDEIVEYLTKCLIEELNNETRNFIINKNN